MLSRLEFVVRGASSVAGSVDSLMLFMLLLCGAVALGVVACITVFVVRYHRGSAAPRAGGQVRTVGIEVSWTLLPLALFIFVFAWSIRLFARIETPPPGATPVYVVARQWMWKLQHVEGVREIDELHVPVGETIKLVMTSEDVIHSFFVPAFRIKQDVLPGRYTQLWFKATRAGTYHLFCSEYCGTLHAHMGGSIVVLPPAQYAQWLSGQARGEPLVARGQELFRNYGCSGCHAAGAAVHAPELQGLFGKPVPLAGGGFAIADEAYFHDSVIQPDKQVVAGFAPIMPSFNGQIREEDLTALTEWFRAGAPQ